MIWQQSCLVIKRKHYNIKKLIISNLSERHCAERSRKEKKVLNPIFQPTELRLNPLYIKLYLLCTNLAVNGVSHPPHYIHCHPHHDLHADTPDALPDISLMCHAPQVLPCLLLIALNIRTFLEVLRFRKVGCGKSFWKNTMKRKFLSFYHSNWWK